MEMQQELLALLVDQAVAEVLVKVVLLAVVLELLDKEIMVVALVQYQMQQAVVAVQVRLE